MKSRLLLNQCADTVKQLLDPLRVAELLKSYAGLNVERVTVTRCWPRAGKSLIVEWLVEHETEKLRWYGQFHARHMNQAMTPMDLPGAAHWIPGLGLVVHRPESDPSMTNLPRCLELPEMIAQSLGLPDARGSVAGILRGYKPGRRATIEYRNEQTRCAVGKTFTTVDGRKLADLHHHLNAALAWHGGSTRVADCLAYSVELNLAVFKPAGGSHPHELDLLIPPLADLHAVRISGLPDFEVSDELAVVRRWIDAIMWIEPDVAARCSSMFDRLRELAADIVDQPRVTIHRDYYEKQVIHCGGRATLIDLDTLALGSPWLDVGNLAAHQCLHGLSTGQPDVCLVQLLQAAAELYPSTRLAIDDRALRFYTASSLLRLGAVHHFRAATACHRETLWQLAADLLSTPPCIAAQGFHHDKTN